MTLQARLEFQRQVRHEGEIFDAQRRQHDGISSRRIWPLC
jgi:hypothetical protein